MSAEGGLMESERDLSEPGKGRVICTFFLFV